MSGLPLPSALSPEVPLLGVIDLRGGQAVHAVAGRRNLYRPLRIPGCPDADPVALAEYYRGLREVGLNIAGLYIADLDRIVDRSEASQAAVERLRRLGLPTWIDRGIETATDLEALDLEAVAGGSKPAVADGTLESGTNWGETTWIVATESLRSLDELRKMVQQHAASATRTRASSLAVSLDLRDGRVVAASREFAERAPGEVAQQVVAAGVERLIVLDVARVGTGSGPATASLCRQIKQGMPDLGMPDLTIGSGGGVRNAADAEILREAGCDFVLAASWLHQ